MTTQIRRNIIELEEVGEYVTDVEEIKRVYNDNITELNYILRNLTLSNLDGEIVTVTIPALSSLRINHKLRLIPKYRIILKQIGGGLIRDLEYTPTYIELENTGADDAIITLIIVKD